MNLLFLLLIALPFCAAQFRIQGPSDGNRAAESLSVDDEGRVEYSGHKAPSSGGFTIQGASDGHSNVQGASDGHSNFQLQAATASGADRYLQPAPAPPAYNIQGASDGHSQIQGSYDGSSSPKSLEYNDPSGLRVNWRSYERNVRPSPQQEPQYTEVQPSLQRAPQRQRARPRPQQPAQVQAQPQRLSSHEPVLPPAQSYENTPAEIKQLLHYQKLLPYINIIPEPFRYENIISAQANQPQQPQYQAEEQPRYIPEPRRPPSRGKARIPSRQKRQAQRQAQRHQAAEQQIQYSTNLPSEIKQILKFQQAIPYINGIPEQFRFNAEAAQKEQLEAVRAHFQQVASSPERHAPRSRQKRQAQYSHQQQQQRQPQRPPPEPQLQYSTNLPGYVKELLKYQAQIPYTILPNLIGVTRPEKPYVPQPVQRPQPAPVPAPLPAAQPQYHSQPNAYQGQANAYQAPANAYQAPANAYQAPASAQPNVAYQGQQNPYQNQIGSYQNQGGAYQDQGNAYQGQPNVYKNQADVYQAQQSAYNQVYQSEVKYPQYQQGQPSQGGIRPVTENQY